MADGKEGGLASSIRFMRDFGMMLTLCVIVCLTTLAWSAVLSQTYRFGYCITAVWKTPKHAMLHCRVLVCVFTLVLLATQGLVVLGIKQCWDSFPIIVSVPPAVLTCFISVSLMWSPDSCKKFRRHLKQLRREASGKASKPTGNPQTSALPSHFGKGRGKWGQNKMTNAQTPSKPRKSPRTADPVLCGSFSLRAG